MKTITTAMLSALATLTVAAGISACGGTAAPVTASASSAAASPSPRPRPTINYAQQYPNDVAPSNAETDRFNAWLTANPNATNAAAATQVTPLYTDLVTFGRTLLQQQWPTNAQADVHALALAVEAEANDYYPKSIASGIFDQTQFDHDESAGESAAQAVRADLGLPPVA